MKKYFIFFMLICSFLLIGAGCKKATNKSASDLTSLENQIQVLLVNEQTLKTEASRLADQGQIKASLAKFDTLIANYTQAKQLNETIADNTTANQEYFERRGELLTLAIDIFEKTKSCIALISEGQKSEDSTAAIDCFTQKVGPLQSGYQAKLQEVTNLSPQTTK